MYGLNNFLIDSVSQNWRTDLNQGLMGQTKLDSLDSAIIDNSILERSYESFIQTSEVVLSEHIIVPVSQVWITYILLVLFLGIAFLWYFIPERVTTIFYFPSNANATNRKESIYNSPGFLTSFLFFINYLVTLSLLVFLIIDRLIPAINPINITNPIFLYIVGIIIFFSFYRMIFIRLTGFVFQTNFIAKQQQLLNININSFIGLILLPVLFLFWFTHAEWLIYAGLFLFLVIYIFKWYQTFFLGKFIPGFSVFHLFMYLCTLEIIPLLALIKLLKSGLV